MLCSRCLDLIGRGDATYCPRCGRHLASASSINPTVAELIAFESRVAQLPPTLRAIRNEIEQSKTSLESRLDLVARRPAFVARVEEALTARLQDVRQRVRASGVSSDGDKATANVEAS